MPKLCAESRSAACKGPDVFLGIRASVRNTSFWLQFFRSTGSEGTRNYATSVEEHDVRMGTRPPGAVQTDRSKWSNVTRHRS